MDSKPRAIQAFPIIKAFPILIFFLSNYMQYIKANLIQIIFMLIAFGLLLYGYLKDEALLMAVSSLLAMLVWLIDSIVNTNKMKNFDDRLKNEEEWYEGA